MVILNCLAWIINLAIPLGCSNWILSTWNCYSDYANQLLRLDTPLGYRQTQLRHSTYTWLLDLDGILKSAGDTHSWNQMGYSVWLIGCDGDSQRQPVIDKRWCRR